MWSVTKNVVSALIGIAINEIIHQRAGCDPARTPSLATRSS